MKCPNCKTNTLVNTMLGEVCTNKDCGYVDGMVFNRPKKKYSTAMKLTYKIVLIDIDGSTFSDKVRAYSFEDALTHIRTKFQGYDIKSVEVI